MSDPSTNITNPFAMAPNPLTGSIDELSIEHLKRYMKLEELGGFAFQIYFIFEQYIPTHVQREILHNLYWGYKPNSHERDNLIIKRIKRYVNNTLSTREEYIKFDTYLLLEEYIPHSAREYIIRNVYMGTYPTAIRGNFDGIRKPNRTKRFIFKKN